MTLHVRTTELGSALESADHYRLGMPHLCPSGLSENWLWKELGHRHWELIGRVFGRAAAGFGREGEQPIYAAFRQISLERGDLGAARENDILAVHSTLSQLSGTRVVSRHRAALGNHPIADVEMTSVFIQRCVASENRSIARVRIDRPSPALWLQDNGHGFRKNSDGNSNDLESWTANKDLGFVVIEPCPALEFNGAGLLYFSSYIAAVDRAEWHLWGKTKRQQVTQRRHAVFHSNIEIGDRLLVRLTGSTEEAAQRHKALIYTDLEQNLLATIVTHRSFALGLP